MEKKVYFLWKKEYELGIPEIDKQHKMLVSYIDELYVAVSEDKQFKTVDDIVRKLIDYTKFHFETEENQLADSDYFDLTNHKLEHNFFVSKILEFDKLLSKRIKITFRLISFLKDWLTKHILVTDKRYVEYFKQKK